MKKLSFIDMMDNLIMEVFRITKEELDLLFDLASEDELKTLIHALNTEEGISTFSQKRKAIEIKHKYLNK